MIYLEAFRGWFSGPINLLDVDSVLINQTVRLLRPLPAHQDGGVSHGQSLDRIRSAGYVLFRSGGWNRATGSVSAVGKSKYL